MSDSMSGRRSRPARNADPTRPRPGAWSAALALLARRDLSEREIRERLEKREYSTSEIEETVGRLRERGYLDDEALARAAASSRAAGRLYGPRQIAAYLHRRGLPAETIRAAVEEAFPGDAEAELAKQAAARLNRTRRTLPARRESDPGAGDETDSFAEPYEGERPPEERKRRERLLRRLVGRGFSWEAALAAVAATGAGDPPDTDDPRVSPA